MTTPRQTIAIAGAGDTAKYLVEELLLDGSYNVVVISRAERPWFKREGVSLQVSDYSKESILSILNSNNASVLFSFLHSNDATFYVNVHQSMLDACRESENCKRFVPSDYGGDIDNFPNLPRFYESTHQAFRRIIAKQSDVEWTLVNHGWFMDYFVQPLNGSKSHMKALPGVWPIDLAQGTVTVLGTGDELIGWTAARDVAKALVRLISVHDWDHHTYLFGEIGSWNEAIAKFEKFHGRQLKNEEGGSEKRHKSVQTIKENLAKHAHDENPSQLWVAYMDEWNITGASAVPKKKAMEQRERYFQGVRFRSIEDLLEDAQRMEVV